METKKVIDVAVEGGEGSGKSSLVAALKLELAKFNVIFVREPGGTPYGEEIRNMATENPLAKDTPAITTFLLMYAARLDLGANIVLPALRKGSSVVRDRSEASTLAYNVYGQQKKELEPLFWYLREDLMVRPDFYIWLDVDPEIGVRRTYEKNVKLGRTNKYDHFDNRDFDFHRRVREGYRKFFNKKKWFFFKKIRYIRIDANRPLEEVKKEFLLVIKRELGV